MWAKSQPITGWTNSPVPVAKEHLWMFSNAPDLISRLWFSSFWIKNSYDLVKQILSGRIAYISWWNTGGKNTNLVFMTNAKSNHSSCPTAHTGLRKPGPVCQVERLNVPLEEKLTAKPDQGEAEFCLLSSMQPFFSFKITLSIQAERKIGPLPWGNFTSKTQFWKLTEVRYFWKGHKISKGKKGVKNVILSWKSTSLLPGVWRWG